MSSSSDANFGRPRQNGVKVVVPAVSPARASATHQHGQGWGDDQFVLLDNPQIDEWSFLRGAHPHALLIGPETRATAAMARLRPYLRAPLVHWHPSALVEPPHATATLVTWEVDTLDQLQQALLLTWMDSDGAGVQVISVSACPVFPLVSEGTFLPDLYYRLNTVCLALPAV